MKLYKDDIILFYGDSITDVERNRSDSTNLGKGYPKLVAEASLEKYQDLDLTFINRGISGDTISELNERLEKDCLTYQPDVVSILIGINDVSQYIRTKDDKGLEKFSEEYTKLLDAISATNPRITLMEPFLLGHPEERQSWRTQLDPLIHCVRQLALKYEAELIPLDGLLNAAGVKYGHQAIAGEDGVHPTDKGHVIIKKAWLDSIEQ